MPLTKFPGVPFVQALGVGGVRSVTQVIVIHATDNKRGASAREEADNATHRPDKTSAHFYIDEHDVVQAVPLDRVAFGCLHHGNQISVQVELCGLSDHISDATMRRAAPIVARLLKEFDLPIVHFGPGEAKQVADGTKGIVGHDTITAAFPQDHGDHTDPGSRFAWTTFLDLVREDDMTPEEHNRLVNIDESVNKMLAMTSPAHLTVGDQPNELRKVLTGLAGDAHTAATRLAGTSVLTAEDRAAIVAEVKAALAPLIPSAAEIARAIRDGQGGPAPR